MAYKSKFQCLYRLMKLLMAKIKTFFVNRSEPSQRFYTVNNFHHFVFGSFCFLFDNFTNPNE